VGKYYASAKSVMEWGTGESTKIAAFLNVSRYTGVDSDTRWLETVALGAPDHFRLIFADIGKTGMWGVPIDRTAKSKYPFYSGGWLGGEKDAFDFYMVDGCFRVACAAAAFLHASKKGKSPEDFVVGVHDYKLRYPNLYKDMITFGDVVEGFDPTKMPASYKPEQLDSYPNIAIFRRRPNVSDSYIKSIYDEYAMR
jgi:hypothetical protein